MASGSEEKDPLFMTAIYMAVFCTVYWIAGYILLTMGVVQLIVRLLSGRPQPDLQRFGGQLGSYLSDIILYVSMRTDQKPYPFANWPDEQRDSVR